MAALAAASLGRAGPHGLRDPDWGAGLSGRGGGGAVLIRQGDEGDAYYAIAAGEFDVCQDDQFPGAGG